jgi:hypothetical protein
MRTVKYEDEGPQEVPGLSKTPRYLEYDPIDIRHIG